MEPMQITITGTKVTITGDKVIGFQLNNLVNRFEATTDKNVYPLDTLEEEYTVTVTAEGYDASEQEVTADQDHVLKVELTPSAAG